MQRTGRIRERHHTHAKRLLRFLVPLEKTLIAFRVLAEREDTIDGCAAQQLLDLLGCIKQEIKTESKLPQELCPKCGKTFAHCFCEEDEKAERGDDER